MLSVYHLQAGIAACHALASSYAETDWAAVLFYYDELLEIDHSAVFALNRAVAISMVAGPEAGLAALDQIEGLEQYYLQPATYAALYERSAQLEKAAQYYRCALAQTANHAEQIFLQKKLVWLTSIQTLHKLVQG